MATKAELLLKTYELRKGSVITKAEIESVCRYLNKHERGTMSAADYAGEWDKLDHMLPMYLTPGHAKQGIDWLRAKFFTPQGLVRNTAMVREVKDYMSEARFKDLLNTVVDFDHFELMGFVDAANNVYMTRYVPRYRVVSTTGNNFWYSHAPLSASMDAE